MHDEMRTIQYTILMLAVASSASSQERVLLTPRGEAIPVRTDQSALQLAKKDVGKHVQELVAITACIERIPLGEPGPVGVNFGFQNGDVAAMIYTTPYTGVIESVYFMSYGSVAIPDSTAFLRIMGANTSGLAATTWMGYWPDSSAMPCDTEVFRTPYEDEATGPYVPGSVSYPPVNGTEYCGALAVTLSSGTREPP